MSSKKDTEIEVMSEEDKKSMEFLKSQEENKVVVIDVPEVTAQEKEVKVSEKNKKKHISIFKQLITPKVYYTGICAYLLSRVGIIVFSLPLLFFTYGDDDDLETSSNQASIEETMKKRNIYFILYVVLFGPILEELIFRLAIFKSIWKIGEKVGKNSKCIYMTFVVLAFLISSFLFGFAHFGFDFSLLIQEYIFFPSYFIPGLAFAGAYYYDNCFLAGVIAHILNNSISTLLQFLLQ